MSCNWATRKLEELISIKHGFAFKGNFFTDEETFDYLITPGNFAIGGGFKGDKFKYYNGPVPEDYILEVGDLVVTMTDLSKQADTLGVSALIPELENHRILHNQRVGLIQNISNEIDKEFLYFLLRSKEYRHHVVSGATGTTVKHTSPTKILSYEFQLPPIEVQRKVAKSLITLEQKATINSKCNETLEEMAQAIFKSWFVDFDPVKAKMKGEQPEGMDATTASLFPEKLVESELGLIPEGWEVSTLSSLIQLTGGGTPKRSEETYWNGDIPWFSVRDVPSGSNVFVVDTDEKITELGLNKSSTKLLPKGTTIITARGTVGKLALVGTDMCMNQSCYGIRGKEVGDFYNYFNLNEAVSTLQRNTHGAVFDTITTKTFDTYSMPFGGVELANKFDSIVAPLLQKIEANVRQNIELSTLRDTLLPKLLSGEIELAEKQEN